MCVNFYQEVEVEADPEEAGIDLLEEIFHCGLGEVDLTAADQADIRLSQSQKIHQQTKVNFTKCLKVATHVSTYLLKK